MDKYRNYIQILLERYTLEELFEHLDVEAEEVIIKLQNLGCIDLDYYMQDEYIDEEVEDEP